MVIYCYVRHWEKNPNAKLVSENITPDLETSLRMQFLYNELRIIFIIQRNVPVVKLHLYFNNNEQFFIAEDTNSFNCTNTTRYVPLSDFLKRKIHPDQNGQCFQKRCLVSSTKRVNQVTELVTRLQTTLHADYKHGL
jgi:hypothetical protein